MSNADGTRTIHLWLPHEGVPNPITLKAITFDMVQRWEAGEIASPVALLAEVSGLQPAIIGLLKYPDAQRVLDEFMFHLPVSVREPILRGDLPTPRGGSPVEPAPQGEHNQDDAPDLGDDADLGISLGGGRD